jgi:L-histidine N-alpha-methyltransferase
LRAERRVSVGSTERLTIDVYYDAADQAATMADDVRRGLTAPQKWLPAKYFYDERGGELFECITELPEYYQTRTELAILQTIAEPLARAYGLGDVVEIGSGSSKKTTALLDAFDRAGELRRFVPIDVDRAMIAASARGLLARYAGLQVHGIVGDFMRHLSHVPPPLGRRLVVFLGSTIGNLNEDERRAFLRDVRGLLGPDGRFLLGVDLVKDVATLEAAYDDAAGVTAEFNRNILRVVNRALHADFVPEAYRHVAFYNREHDRIEMHLQPETAQLVQVRNLDLRVTIRPDETIFTEISCKYTRETAAAALAEAGLDLAEWHTDPDGKFAVALAARSVTP